jgi:hypothetical protein
VELAEYADLTPVTRQPAAIQPLKIRPLPYLSPKYFQSSTPNPSIESVCIIIEFEMRVESRTKQNTVLKNTADRCMLGESQKDRQ